MAKNESSDVPPKEREMESTGRINFGVCDECGNLIRYPSIEFPISCKEIDNNNGLLTYEKETVSLHVSCSLQRLLNSNSIEYEITSEYEVKKPWMKKWFNMLMGFILKSISYKIKVKTYQFNSAFVQRKNNNE